MGLFANTITDLPSSVARLIQEFREGLLTTLGANLLGAYLHGSVAFPEYRPEAGDIDFYVLIRRSLGKAQIDALDLLHRSLADKFKFGRKLDGFYIPLNKARRTTDPGNLVYGAHGRIHHGGSDDAWPLHREHFHGSAYLRLYGPKASRIFPTADWASIRSTLYHQLVYARRIIDSDPWWAVLNLCRLIYNFERGRVVISKLAAGRWALKHLPSKWRPVIMSAIRTYKGTVTGRDRAVLRREARKFLGFASVRIVAFDTTWDSRQPHIAHLRKRRHEAQGQS